MGPARAQELITSAKQKDGDEVPYVLFAKSAAPKYVVILFPGGEGNLNPRLKDGQIKFGFVRTFTIASREELVDDEFAGAAMNSTWSESTIQAVIDDLKRRFPAAKLYLMSTSKSTYATMKLAGYLQDKIAGEIHTSSFQQWAASFDGKKYKNRQLFVHHKHDQCFRTPYSGVLSSHEKFGTELVTMEGGTTDSDYCEPGAHHGFAGIRAETIAAIKAWIKAAP